MCARWRPGWVRECSSEQCVSVLCRRTTGLVLMGCADADRLPWTAARRTTVLGLLIGGVLRALRWSKEYLEEQVQTRARQTQLAVAEGRDEVLKAVGAALGGEERKRD